MELDKYHKSVYTDHMSGPTKLSKEERRERIMAVARELFSRKGLDGARTVDLARMAGVSERLLYKHFPSKKALHSAVLKSYIDEVAASGARILELEPSTSTLVLLTHFLASKFLMESMEHESFLRMGARSLAEDGQFIRFAHGSGSVNAVIDKMQKCIDRAIESGDIPKSEGPAPSAVFVDALILGTAHALLPKPAAINFRLGRAQVIEQLVWFSLRGINLDDKTIARYYNPKALSLLGG